LASPTPPAIVETFASAAPGGVTASTVKLSGKVNDSSAAPPGIVVTTLTVRGSSAAVGETTIAATAVVSLITVTGPSSPKPAPPTAISPPSDARVCPVAQ